MTLKRKTDSCTVEQKLLIFRQTFLSCTVRPWSMVTLFLILTHHCYCKSCNKFLLLSIQGEFQQSPGENNSPSLNPAGTFFVQMVWNKKQEVKRKPKYHWFPNPLKAWRPNSGNKRVNDPVITNTTSERSPYAETDPPFSSTFSLGPLQTLPTQAPAVSYLWSTFFHSSNVPLQTLTPLSPQP